MQVKVAMLDWDDLRYVLAIARAGNITAAAPTLGVHESTVLRRLNSLEKQLGTRLFERFPGGYLTTPAGEEVYRTAGQMEENIQALDRRISGQDLQLRGTIRVTTTDSLLLKLLTPHFIAFQTAYPEIELETIVSNQIFNLTKRDADIAIRATNHPPETLVGRRVASVASAIYGSKTYLAFHPKIEDLSRYTWIGLDESVVQPEWEQWLQKAFPGIRYQYRVNTLIGILAAVKEHLGIALLYCFMADRDPDLQAVHPPIPKLAKNLWILTHADIRNVTRIRTFIDFIGTALKGNLELLEGRCQKC
ncbi:LysR family transcriptional regulator [Nostoc sp.]|uniref:LysR family transcriptional regulator n=1 Tax=Nostoc sp. TaxID=1180 RepID=UPI002FFD3B46